MTVLAFALGLATGAALALWLRGWIVRTGETLVAVERTWP